MTELSYINLLFIFLCHKALANASPVFFWSPGHIFVGHIVFFIFQNFKLTWLGVRLVSTINLGFSFRNMVVENLTLKDVAVILKILKF